MEKMEYDSIRSPPSTNYADYADFAPGYPLMRIVRMSYLNPIFIINYHIKVRVFVVRGPF